MNSIKIDPQTHQPIFPENVQMLVYCEGDQFYLRTRTRGIRIRSGYRRKLRITHKMFDGIEYDWVCHGKDAETIIYDNAKLKNAAGQVIYTNPNASYFWQVGDIVYKKLGKACVEKGTKYFSGQQLRKMMTNCAEGYTNAFDEMLPVFTEGSIEFEDPRTGKANISGLTDDEVQKVLKNLEKSEKNARPTWNPQNGYWEGDTRAMVVRAYLQAKGLSDEELKRVQEHYSERIKQVNDLVAAHADEFYFDDEGQYGFDCGFMTTAIVDREYWDDYLLLVNDYRTKCEVPEVRMPKMVQSLTVQRREFNKVITLAKREIGCNLCILTSYLD